MKTFQRIFHVESLEKTAQDDFQKLASAVYLQVSTVSQALIFVTRSRSWSFVERPGFLLVFAFLVAQLVSSYPPPPPHLSLEGILLPFLVNSFGNYKLIEVDLPFDCRLLR
jgi:hypothetical protein